MTACSSTNNPAGWRDHRQQGGVVLHLPSNEIIATNLSMPHSPRWYQGKLWLLNSGTGKLGYIDKGKFTPITFCQGFVRGLAFWENYAFVGFSKLRTANFTGLELENCLKAQGKVPLCGLMVIDLRNGDIVHSLIIEGAVEELFDVVVIPNTLRPRALGFQDEDIERLINFPDSQGLITTKPTVKRPSIGVTAPIAGLPTKKRLEVEAQEVREIEALEYQEVKFQRVYHLNPESLAPYDTMTFPSLQQRWRNQPQRGELIGVSASVSGDMVGFAIAELLPNFKAEVIYFFVHPNFRQRGIGTKMMTFLKRELFTQNYYDIKILHTNALTLLDKGNKIPSTPLNKVNEEVKSHFEEGKQRVQIKDLEGAINCFQKAITLQPDYIPAYNQLGNVLQMLGKPDEAIATYQRLLEINPNVAPAYCNLGSILQIQGSRKIYPSSYTVTAQFCVTLSGFR